MALVDRAIQNPDLGVALIARELGLPVRRLQRVVAAEGGTTTRALIAEARMQRAYDLMVHQGLPARAVAPRVGYRGAPYLAKRFRERFGAPPHVLRDRYQAVRKRR